MPTFRRRPFRPSKTSINGSVLEKLAARYRASLSRHPFLLFGLPFIGMIVGSSFLLTPATALRYERHDRRTRQVEAEEALGLGIGVDDKRKRKGRKVDINEEYYRLAAKDLDDWEQRRVDRLPGESDGKL